MDVPQRMDQRYRPDNTMSHFPFSVIIIIIIIITRSSSHSSTAGPPASDTVIVPHVHALHFSLALRCVAVAGLRHR